MTPKPAESGSTPAAAQPQPRTLLMLLGILAIALAVYAYGGLMRSRERNDPLHGDADDAAGAVARIVATDHSGDLLPRLLALSDDANAATRYAAVDALGRVHDARSTARVEAAFQDSAAIVRQRAMEVLLDLDPQRGLPMLLSGLRDEDTWIREAAAQQCVTRVGHPGSAVDRRAVPALVAALDDPTSAAVPALAVGALHRLTGQTWHYRAAAPESAKRAVKAQWKAWWAANTAKWRIAPTYAAPPLVVPTRADPAPAFSLRDIEGGTVQLGSQRGRVTLLNFWGTWCPPCIGEAPALADLDRTYRSRGVDVIGIALSETGGAGGLRKWCRDHDLGYRQCLAVPDILDAYGHIHEVPVSVLIDQAGRIRYRWEGERDLPTFRAAVERVLRNPPR